MNIFIAGSAKFIQSVTAWFGPLAKQVSSCNLATEDHALLSSAFELLAAGKLVCFIQQHHSSDLTRVEYLAAFVSANRVYHLAGSQSTNRTVTFWMIGPMSAVTELIPKFNEYTQ